ncbi:heavy metal-associated isoprenylated plant protein 39-like isoform X1 [Macadamia integrifolia]|uniref:heavy metal-associated isoprenylated plant protein 39-like isoform X1 n=2 Tax=Macadamia integrifolia TaxID=60698 RepID=UPI001C4EA630|nr:heavy metal-associated isoprenylated plant protein 39-like isoform X1 [Macadamia integrifolia]
MKKVVVKVEVYDAKSKLKAMRAVSSVSGINSISVDMEKHLMTVIGEVDPVDIVGKLRKFWQHTVIDFVGPPEEPKKEEPKKEEPKKEEPKKEEPKKEEPKKEEKKEDPIAELIQLMKERHESGHPYNIPYGTTYYSLKDVSDTNPNTSCVIS